MACGCGPVGGDVSVVPDEEGEELAVVEGKRENIQLAFNMAVT